MLQSTLTRGSVISIYLPASIILLTQDLGVVMHASSLIVAFGIIWLSGDGLMFGIAFCGHFLDHFLTVFRPVCKEELYNLRHAEARNVVERIFGVIKKRWTILTKPPQLDIELQARILPGLAAIHNLIMKHDPTDLQDFGEVHDPEPGYVDFGSLAEGPTSRAEKARADAWREEIAENMWESYKNLLRERGLHSQTSSYYKVRKLKTNFAFDPHNAKLGVFVIIECRIYIHCRLVLLQHIQKFKGLGHFHPSLHSACTFSSIL
jgi:hypothetical protein